MKVFCIEFVMAREPDGFVEMFVKAENSVDALQALKDANYICATKTLCKRWKNAKKSMSETSLMSCTGLTV